MYLNEIYFCLNSKLI